MFRNRVLICEQWRLLISPNVSFRVDSGRHFACFSSVNILCALLNEQRVKMGENLGISMDGAISTSVMDVAG